ncbi:MAG: hypothetical protein JKY42_01175 [Flavobacteriales bacterium]|nr:hypothetical protein [Flavobacteriales bacterium]
MKKGIIIIATVALFGVLIQGGINLAAGSTTAEYSELSDGAKQLIAKAYKDLDQNQLIDFHTHIAALGTDCNYCYVNKNMMKPTHIKSYVQFKVYAKASGIRNLETADQQFFSTLQERVADYPGKVMLLAFDETYSRAGIVDKGATQFYISNEYMYRLYLQDTSKFIPCVSIHPYRKDAVDELRYWAGKGVKVVKWLPNAMLINPSDSICMPFYQAMAMNGMALLTHAGHEDAVHADDSQALGNPLLLRQALDQGVKVVVAHCASSGESIDLDDPKETLVSNFDLLLRMMNEEQYDSLLFADISAMTLRNRVGEPLRKVLENPQIHNRLINGSDYPLPAINVLISTRKLYNEGYLTNQEHKQLDEIYQYNPLVFDFVLKRTIRHPENNKLKFADEVFEMNQKLEL